MKRQFLFLALLGVFAAIGFAPSTVRAESEAIETGRLLAILLDSGRVVVGANQSLINDPDKGDKNFNPDTFEKQLTAKYKDRAKVDLDNLKSEKVPELAKKLLPQLVEAEKKTVADYQPVINKQGVGFKGFIPATFGTQAAAKFVAKTGVYLKQTTTDNLLRNPKNKADEFEVAVMKRFAEPSYPRTGEKIITEATDGGKTMRVMLPLYYGKGCLGCHGDPKGEKDISGYMKEGKKEGELGGAISVQIASK
ncbi:MAG: DUF3365 domain-containing protein [Nitrospirae bacterium]|nr:MAG: DUF3365 domain-containing protein [Nitrospirota bacterium]